MLGFIEIILVDGSICQKFQIPHLVPHSFHKSLYISQLVVLIDWIVDHALTKPIDSSDLMLENVVVEGTIEVASMLKSHHVYVPDQHWSYYDDCNYQEEMECDFARSWLHLATTLQ